MRTIKLSCPACNGNGAVWQTEANAFIACEVCHGSREIVAQTAPALSAWLARARSPYEMLMHLGGAIASADEAADLAQKDGRGDLALAHSVTAAALEAVRDALQQVLYPNPPEGLNVLKRVPMAPKAAALIKSA